MPYVSGNLGDVAYVPPITRAQYSGNDVSIANGAAGTLTWDTKVSGTALLNITVPSIPTIVTAGVYAVSVWIAPAAGLTLNGNYEVTLSLDAAGDNAPFDGTASPSVAGATVAALELTGVYYIPAGGQITAVLGSNDGVSTRNFAINTAVVQRIS